MAGSGWQHLAGAAKDLAGGARAALGKAAAVTGREVRHIVAGDESPPVPPAGADGRHVEGQQGGMQQAPLPLHCSEDIYGFKLEVTAEQLGILERCRAREEAARARWQAAPLGEGGLPTPEALKKLCRKGVPPDMRRPVWLEMSGANARRQRLPPHYYASSALQGRDSPYAHQIELDVPRTFPNNAWVQSQAGQDAVRNVLLACAHHNPRVGYCQSMNYLAAMLLLALGRDEEDAFWVMASLIDDEDDGILYRDMYARDLTGTHVEMRCLRELVGHKLPRLGSHMDALGCDMSILATDWFLCLFCTSLPSETAARVWDALLNEGTKVLFRTALALLKLHEPLLLAQDNPGELLRAARRVACEAFDRDALMKVAFEGVGSMPMERINNYRERKQREVDKEMAARETRANLAAAVQQQGFVVTEHEAVLLARDAGTGPAAAVAPPAGGEAVERSVEGSASSGSAAGMTRGSSAPARVGVGGPRWLQTLGVRAKDSIDRGRMRIAHRRGQSLGASVAAFEGPESTA